MSATSVKLLEVAAEIAGGSGPLAGRLGITESQLTEFMKDERPFPDGLLLRVVDIVLADRHLHKQIARMREGPGEAA